MSPKRLPISELALGVALAIVSGCGARNDLPVPGDDGGGQGGENVSREPVCGRVEACNGIDDDCDGTVDEECVDAGVRTGCADGEREGYLDDERYPDIAACAGGFEIAGVAFGPEARCGHISGDDGTDPSGFGCSANDLCADGWAVCPSESEVARLAGGCADAAVGAGVFFATQQSGPGCGICALGTNDSEDECDCQCVEGCAPRPWTTNDVFGCGTIGDETTRCGVLGRFSNDQCGRLGPPWSCSGAVPGGGADSCREASVASKLGPEGGGVLCCRSVRGT